MWNEAKSPWPRGPLIVFNDLYVNEDQPLGSTKTCYALCHRVGEEGVEENSFQTGEVVFFDSHTNLFLMSVNHGASLKAFVPFIPVSCHSSPQDADNNNKNGGQKSGYLKNLHTFYIYFIHFLYF